MIEMRENEAAALRALQSAGGNCSFGELVTSSGQSSAAITRALTILRERQLVRVNESEQTLVHLTQEGQDYAKQGLPERRLVQAVLESGGEATLEQTAKRKHSATTCVGCFGMGQDYWMVRGEHSPAESRSEGCRHLQIRRTLKKRLNTYPQNPKPQSRICPPTCTKWLTH